MKKINSKLEVVCYVMAAVLFVIAAYVGYANIAYLQSYVEAYGMELSDIWEDVLQYVISGFVPYFAYGFMILVLGRILNRVSGGAKAETVAAVAEEAVEPVVEAEEETDK